KTQYYARGDGYHDGIAMPMRLRRYDSSLRRASGRYCSAYDARIILLFSNQNRYIYGNLILKFIEFFAGSASDDEKVGRKNSHHMFQKLVEAFSPCFVAQFFFLPGSVRGEEFNQLPVAVVDSA